MTKDEAKAHFKKLTSGLTKEQQDALATALENESFADEVAKGFMLQADYSRSKNEVAAERKKQEEEVQAKWKELNDWYASQKPIYDQAAAIYQDYTKIREALGQPAGQGPQTQQTQTTGGQMPYLTVDQARKLLEENNLQLGQGVGTLVKDAVKISNDYHKRFGEYPDIDAFDDYLAQQRKTDPSLTVMGAYRSWIEPKVEERRTAEFDRKLKEAKEEAVRDYASKHHIPVDTAGPKEYSPAWDPKRHDLAKLNPEQQEENARNGFFEEWAKAGAAANQ